MAAISCMPNITGLTVSMHKLITGIIKLIKPTSAVEDMIPGSFQSYQLHLETLVVSEQRYILGVRNTLRNKSIDIKL